MSAPLLGAKKRRHSNTLAPAHEFRRAGHLSFGGIEVRDGDQSGNLVTVTGTPIVYNTPYTVRDMFGEFQETMLPGVATGVLTARQDVRLLIDHESSKVMARSSKGTMTLVDTPAGLTFSASLDLRSQMVNDFVVQLERGDVDQMSCGFVVGQDDWNADYSERSISLLDLLLEISGVTFPASPTTSIELALRSMMGAPIESRARVRRAWIASREARAGKVLSSENADLLQRALSALHEADDVDIPGIVGSLQKIDAAVDAGQAGLAAVLDKANPDGDKADKDPALVDSDDEDDEGGDDTDDAGEGSDAGEERSAARPGTKAPATRAARDERRAATGFFSDIESAVYTALKATYGDPADDWCDVWVEDLSEAVVVFQSWEDNPGPGLWQVAYTRDVAGAVTLVGDPQPVVVQTTYAPVPADQGATRSLLLEIEEERYRLHRRARPRA